MLALVSIVSKKINTNYFMKNKKECLLNSTGNSAQFGWILAGLAVVFNRQIQNGSQDFFLE
jgi:hypothetical protein